MVPCEVLRLQNRMPAGLMQNMRFDGIVILVLNQRNDQFQTFRIEAVRGPALLLKMGIDGIKGKKSPFTQQGHHILNQFATFNQHQSLLGKTIQQGGADITGIAGFELYHERSLSSKKIKSWQ
jgi:hypothetical protein